MDSPAISVDVGHVIEYIHTQYATLTQRSHFEHKQVAIGAGLVATARIHSPAARLVFLLRLSFFTAWSSIKPAICHLSISIIKTANHPQTSIPASIMAQIIENSRAWPGKGDTPGPLPPGTQRTCMALCGQKRPISEFTRAVKAGAPLEDF